jgi:hypothetical protein
MAVAMTSRESRLGDAALLFVLGVFCVRSYEAMIYLGPLLAAAIVWSLRKNDDPATRLIAGIAALAFIAAAVVSAATIAEYWAHPHFIKVRSMSFDFWQNLQFSIPLVGLAICVAAGLRRAAWLEGRGPLIVMGSSAALLALTPWWRLLHEHSILYPPSHYLARQAAGLLLAALLGCMWVYVAWQRRPPAVLATLRQPVISRRLVTTMTVLVIAAAVPDVVLTGLWSGYVGRMRNVVDSRQGIVRASDLPLLDWPDKLFAQDWSLPAMSAIVSRAPGRAFVRVDDDFLSNPPFDPACGTLPRLKGYGWR